MEITSSPEGVNLNDATITQVDLLDGAVLLALRVFQRRNRADCGLGAEKLCFGTRRRLFTPPG
jgi:hypothetical protein